ncbi:MAG: hypothetical protein Fur0018_05800 [Anaerolineales bacterium]
MSDAKRPFPLVFGFFFVLAVVVWYFWDNTPWRGLVDTATRHRQVWAYLSEPQTHADWAIPAGTRCGRAPLLMPTTGFIGYLWDDSFRPGHRHTGLDIFSGREPGLEPVYAAADGYITREETWKSALIERIPADPLSPGRQILLYYTHMADPQGNSYIVSDFPPGTHDVFVAAGTLLGYQGNYSGDPANPVGVHLHFSIVRDQNGRYLNEQKIENTLDPSPYLGMSLNAHQSDGSVTQCKGNPIP